MSIIPYAASEVNPYLAAATAVYEHREQLSNMASGAAKRVQRAWRNRSSRQSKKARARGSRRRNPREKVGKHPSEVSDAKFHTPTDIKVNHSTRTMYSYEVTGIPLSDTNNDIDGRQRQQVFLNGVKLAMTIQNTGSVPLHVNVAMVMNRTSPGSAPSTSDFFRGSGSDRGLDFTSAILNSNDYRSRAINPDTNVILFHKRMTLSAATDIGNTYEAGWKPSFTTLDKYTSIKRIITYDGITDIANNRVYLVFWCDRWQNPTGAGTTSNAMTVQTRLITDFKEPKVTY